MSKKAQGMSLNVVIIAALGLLVLVVLAIIFTGRTGIFVRESDKCVTNGGKCVATQAECVGDYERIARGACDLSGDGKFNFNNVDSDGYCCLSVSSPGTQ